MSNLLVCEDNGCVDIFVMDKMEVWLMIEMGWFSSLSMQPIPGESMAISDLCPGLQKICLAFLGFIWSSNRNAKTGKVRFGDVLVA